MERKSDILRQLLRFLLYTACVWLIMSIDLFGYSAMTRPYSAALFNRIFSVAVPDITHGKAPAVVVINQNTQQRRGSPAERFAQWPSKFEYHAATLDHVNGHDPKTIFLDLMFTHKRDDETYERFEKKVGSLVEDDSEVGLLDEDDSSEGKNIYVAKGPRRMLIPSLKNTLNPGNLLSVSVVDSDSPGMPTLSHKIFTRYPAIDPVSANSGSERFTAAFEIFRDFHCGDERNDTAADGSAEGEDGTAWADAICDRNHHNLQIVWPLDAPDINEKRLAETKTCGDEPNFWNRVAWGLFQPSALMTECAPIRELGAHQFNRIDDEKLDDALAGRVVFYGVDLPWAGDHINSPVHGQMPAVYAHAMAYHNLLAFGSNYKRREITVGGFAITLAGIEYVLAAMLCFIAILYHSAVQGIVPSLRLQGPSDPTPGDTPDLRVGGSLWHAFKFLFFRILCFVAVLFGVLIGAAWLVFDWLNLYPLDWIDLLSLTSLLAALVWQRPIERVIDALANVLSDRTAEPRESPQ